MNLFPVGFLHRLATAIAPQELAAGGMLLFAMVTLVVGLVRRGRAFLPQALMLVYLILGVIGFLPLRILNLSVVWHWVMAAGAVAALVAGLVFQRVASVSEDPKHGPRRTDLLAWVCLGMVLVASSLFVFHRLRDYAGTLLVWESPVSQELGRFYQSGQGLGRFAFERLLWDDGLMSRGEKSLLYGVPTYALVRSVEFSTWTLRVVPAVTALAAIVLIFLVVRRFFGSRTAAAAAGLLAFNACFLFYARYATLSSATLATIVLALGAAWWFLLAERWVWLKGALCGLALCLATFHYAPGRLVVLVLLALISLFVLLQRPKWGWSRGLGLILLWGVVVGLWAFESYHDHARVFLNARGEQYTNFVKDRYWIRQYLGQEIDPNKLTPLDKREILLRVLKTTIPQYVWFFTPGPAASPPGRSVLDLDPPRIKLFFGPLAVFVLWGFVYSLRRLTDARHAALVAWIILCTPPLLLTNRVDTHRIFLFVVPLTIWAALGLRETVRCLRQAQMPAWTTPVLAAFLGAVLVQDAAWQLFFDRPRPSAMSEMVAAEIEKIPGPVLLTTDGIDHRDVSWVNIRMVERQRQNPARQGGIIDRALAEAVRDGGTYLDPVQVWTLLNYLKTRTLIFAPADRFDDVVRRLGRGGIVTEVRGIPPFEFYVAFSPNRAGGNRGSEK